MNVSLVNIESYWEVKNDEVGDGDGGMLELTVSGALFIWLFFLFDFD